MVATDPPRARRRGVCHQVEIAMQPGAAMATARLLRLLGDPTRLSMLATLRGAGAPVCICDFTAAYALGQPTVSHHMGRLRSAGLVTSHKEGIWVYYRIAEDLPDAASRLLDAVLGGGG